MRQAVSLDPHYLNAWLLLYGAGDHTYIEPAELDIARFKLLELDPTHRHARYTLEKVGDMAGLWRGAERAAAVVAAAKPVTDGVYRLRASAAAADAAVQALPPEMRAQMQVIDAFSERSYGGTALVNPVSALADHQFVKAAQSLAGDGGEGVEY